MNGSISMHGVFKLIVLLVFLLIQLETCNAEQTVLVAVACEDHIFHANCHTPHQVIRIVKAIFGRFSLRPCIGNLDDGDDANKYLPLDQMDLQCSATNTTDFVKRRCDNQQSCMLEASTRIFGDPCIGTPKYLEIQYKCINKERKVPVHVPDGEDEFEDDELDVTKANLPTPTLPSPSHVTSGVSDIDIQNIGILPPLTTSHKGSISTNDVLPMTTKAKGDARNVTSQTKISTCPQSYVRQISWPQTEIGVSVQQLCPYDANGFARWYCGSGGTWYPEYPDLSECSSHWSLELENELTANNTPPKILSAKLLNVSTQNQILGGDLKRVLRMMNTLTTKEFNALPDDTEPSFRRRTDAKTEVQHVVRDLLLSSDRLLSDNYMAPWLDLPIHEQRKSATHLLQNIEDVGKLLLKSMFTLNDGSPPHAQTFYDLDNLVLKIFDVNHGNGSGPDNDKYHRITFSLPPNNSRSRLSTRATEKIRLSISNLPKGLNGTTHGKYSVALLEGNLKYLLPQQNYLGTTPTSPKNDSIPLSDDYIATRIISITTLHGNFSSPPLLLVPGKGSTSPDHVMNDHTNPIIFLTFPILNDRQHGDPLLKKRNPKCVFLRYDSSDQDGNWSTAGCWVHEIRDTSVTCACNHMTNFAVLLDVVGIEIPINHETALIIITQIGCIISILCLIVCVITFQYFKNLLNERMIIHKHLCVCLLIAEILFVTGIQATSLKIGCSIIAGLLHYFFLTAFMWMLIEGLQLYTMLVEVFESEKSRIRYFILLAYGLPFIIVLISALTYPQGYGTDKYCWLSTNNYFVFSFAGPALAILVANFIFLGIALYIMGRHFGRMPNHSDKSKLTILRIWLKGAFILIFLMGLTWFFGFLFLNQETIFAAYLFTILNSFQGLFIFIFHCLLNDKVIKEYRKLMYRSPLVPTWLKTYFTTTSTLTGSSGGGMIGGGSSNKNIYNHNKMNGNNNNSNQGPRYFERDNAHNFSLEERKSQEAIIKVCSAKSTSPVMTTNVCTLYNKSETLRLDSLSLRKDNKKRFKEPRSTYRPSFLQFSDFVRLRDSNSYRDEDVINPSPFTSSQIVGENGLFVRSEAIPEPEVVISTSNNEQVREKVDCGGEVKKRRGDSTYFENVLSLSRLSDIPILSCTLEGEPEQNQSLDAQDDPRATFIDHDSLNRLMPREKIVSPNVHRLPLKNGNYSPNLDSRSHFLPFADSGDARIRPDQGDIFESQIGRGETTPTFKLPITDLDDVSTMASTSPSSSNPNIQQVNGELGSRRTLDSCHFQSEFLGLPYGQPIIGSFDTETFSDALSHFNTMSPKQKSHHFLSTDQNNNLSYYPHNLVNGNDTIVTQTYGHGMDAFDSTLISLSQHKSHKRRTNSTDKSSLSKSLSDNTLLTTHDHHDFSSCDTNDKNLFNYAKDNPNRKRQLKKVVVAKSLSSDFQIYRADDKASLLIPPTHHACVGLRGEG